MGTACAIAKNVLVNETLQVTAFYYSHVKSTKYYQKIKDFLK